MSGPGSVPQQREERRAIRGNYGPGSWNPPCELGLPVTLPRVSVDTRRTGTRREPHMPGERQTAFELDRGHEVGKDEECGSLDWLAAEDATPAAIAPCPPVPP